MITQIILTFLGWIVLLVVSTNLAGMLIRGLVMIADVENQISKMDEKLKKVASEFYNPKVEREVNYIALGLIIVYLSILFYFWNFGVVISALMIMIARIPDLLWEIKYDRENIIKMPKIYMLTTLIMFGALPVLWYSIYRM